MSVHAGKGGTLLLLALISLLAFAPAAVAQEEEAPPSYHSPLIVPVDWSLVPRGMGPGGEFRLLFVTSSTRDATATDIGTYHAFVQEEAAGGHDAIRPYSAHFRVLGATSAVDARIETGTHPDDGEGVPIFWLNGREVADNNADLYDGGWVHPNPGRLPDGTELTFQQQTVVFTGIWEDGETSQWPLGGRGLPEMLETRSGRPGGGRPLAGGRVASSESHRFYALSGVFRVRGATPLQVGLGHIFTGELTRDDGGEDLYRFEATANTNYIIEVKTPLVPSTAGDPLLMPGYLIDPSILRVFDTNDAVLLGEHDRGGFALNWARAFFTAPATDTYFVAVGAGAQDRTGRGTYTISVREDDHADDYRTNPAVVLRPGSTVTAVIDSNVAPDDPRLNWWDWRTSPHEPSHSEFAGLKPRRGIESLDDRDVFRMEISDAGNYRVTLVGQPADVRLWFFWDGAGNRLVDLPDVFVTGYSLALQPGTYYVEVGTLYASSNPHASFYSLRLGEALVVDEVADCPASQSSHCALEVGQLRTGLMEDPMDRDWWAVSLEPGKTYRVQLRGAGDQSGGGDNGGTVENTHLTLHDPSGTVLASNDNVAADNRNSRIVYAVPAGAGGRYYLEASQAPGSGTLFPTYTISVEEVAPPPLN